MLSHPTVCLFRASLDLDDGLLAALSATLSAEELARARAMRTARLRARLIADLGWRRRLLSQRLGSSPESIRFRRESGASPTSPAAGRTSAHRAARMWRGTRCARRRRSASTHSG